MSLSNDLMSQFAKITKDEEKTKNETVVYGTVNSIEKVDGTIRTIHVLFDGADKTTPISSSLSTASVNVEDRVTVMIKNHSAVITGNITNPSARSSDVENIAEAASKITEVEILLADKVSTDEFDTQVGRIDTLVSENTTITERLTASEGDIGELQADYLVVEKQLTTNTADIERLQTDKLDVQTASITYATIKELEATNLNVNNLSGVYAEFEVTTTERLDAIDAAIEDLDVNSLTTTEADIRYANIEFSNITKSAMEYLYSVSGLIENVIVGDGTITGKLIGVTIVGDSIEAGTLVADRLVVKGEDGLYYKLNTDGVTTEAEQTEYNSLNGSVILAKSITAEKVAVDDLVAFDATIGGFNINETAIFSEVKDSEDNTVRGIYMDTDGQFNIGDSNNYIKYYRDDDGNYKLVVSAESILYNINGDAYSLADLGVIGEYVHIGSYDGEPCIELGDSESDFRLIITNTKMVFMEGTGIPAYFSNQALNIDKAVIEDELQHGDHFLWKTHNNGNNLGLVWKG